MKNCTICGHPITLIPSAAERSRKYGDHPPSYYTNLFTEHSNCTLRKRKADVEALIQRTRQ